MVDLITLKMFRCSAPLLILTRIVAIQGIRRQSIPKLVIGPEENDHHHHNCEKFTQTARFNPYSVTDDTWMTFYYWAAEDDGLTAEFLVPTKKETDWLKVFMEPLVEKPVNWSARLLLMRDFAGNTTYMLTERADRGQYWIYSIAKHYDGRKKVPMDIRLKQTADNKYLGLMKCNDETLYIMARVQDMPSNAQLHEAAATMRYRRRGGRSYLYQGHQWMPIPEYDHRKYWLAYQMPQLAHRVKHEYFFD